MNQPKEPLTSDERLKQCRRVEETAMDVLYYAEQWSTTGATFFDLKRRRESLLEAARRYGRAVDNLARKR